MSRPEGRGRRGLLLLALLAAGIAALWFFWLRHCGIGVGKGGLAPGVAADAGPPGGAGAAPRCAVRVDASGILLDGKRASVEEAVAACKAAGAATLTVTGDAIYGTAQRLQEELRRAGVTITTR